MNEKPTPTPTPAPAPAPTPAPAPALAPTSTPAPTPEGIEALVALADTGSLSRAAALLASSQPTVGRKVRALEDAVGQALVVRQGRGLALTPAGEELAAAGREVVRALGRFGLVARALGRELAGQVRVSASEAVATELLPSWVVALRHAHPGLRVALVAEDRITDVAHRESDLAVRMFRPRDPELVAVKLGEAQMALWASRDYIARAGHPKTRADLASHQAIGFDRDALADAVFQSVVGDLPDVRVALRTDSSATSLAAVRAGVGIGAVQRPVALRYPELVEVALDARLPTLEAWLVTASDLRRARAIRAAFDHLRAWLTALLDKAASPVSLGGRTS